MIQVIPCKSDFWKIAIYVFIEIYIFMFNLSLLHQNEWMFIHDWSHHAIMPLGLTVFNIDMYIDTDRSSWNKKSLHGGPHEIEIHCVGGLKISKFLPPPLFLE